MHTYRDFLTTALAAAAKIAVANFGNLSHSVKAGDRNQVLTETRPRDWSFPNGCNLHSIP